VNGSGTALGATRLDAGLNADCALRLSGWLLRLGLRLVGWVAAR
jgi:hypothetical protein